MRSTLLKPVALLMAAALVLGACATESTEDFGASVGNNGALPDPNLGPIAPGTGLGHGSAPTSDQVVQAALTDVQSFWSRSFQRLYGKPYQPIQGGFWAYGPTTKQPPCGTPPPSYKDIAENAFYCPQADLIAWDNVHLVPGLYDQFGGFTLGLVFAHEFGHAIQTRAGTQGPTILLELQADCFAGAWTADVAAGHSTFFKVDVTDLDKAVAGFLELRDGVGTNAADPAAHGTGFDRIGSFSEGYEQGLDRCKRYPDLLASGSLVITEVPFSDPADFQTGGNLPLDQLSPLLQADLENFWTAELSLQHKTWKPVADVVDIDPSTDTVRCGRKTYRGKVLVNASFYCIDSNTIYIDRVTLIPALNDIGDYAVATEIARQYAYAAQVQLGNTSSSLSSNLQADCFTGVYAASGFTGDRQGKGQKLFLSPGDLDEAVIAFLSNSDASNDVAAPASSVGTAFQRFDAYRSGFVSGMDACTAITSG